MNYKIFSLFIFILFSHSAHSQNWNGKYLSISGRYNLVIDYSNENDKMLSFEIFDLKTSERISSSIAFFRDGFATTHSLHVKDECITRLGYSIQGIFVSDFCGGSDTITGFYQKTDDFTLESLRIIPSVE